MQAVLGWRCAVIPHWDNREGGTHDTRYCWIGGRRLAQLEPAVAGGFILGIDEHTAFVVDLAAGRVSVVGRGEVVLRVAGVEEVLAAGTELSLDEVEAMVRSLGAPAAVPGRGVGGGAGRGDAGRGELAHVDPAPPHGGPADPHEPTAEGLARAVLAALPPEASDARADLVALLGLVDASRQDGARHLADQLVAALVELRTERRTARDWAGSDAIRDRLTAVGVEVQDGPAGSTWEWR
jgi:hypothetical protein